MVPRVRSQFADCCSLKHRDEFDTAESVDTWMDLPTAQLAPKSQSRSLSVSPSMHTFEGPISCVAAIDSRPTTKSRIRKQKSRVFVGGSAFVYVFDDVTDVRMNCTFTCDDMRLNGQVNTGTFLPASHMSDAALCICTWRQFVCVGTANGSLLLYSCSDSGGNRTYTHTRTHKFDYPVTFLFPMGACLYVISRFGVHTVFEETRGSGA